ncbi:MAG: type II toxin-antitoxin system RelE/ParE family toxin [Bacteroidota bacterium]
MDSQPVEVQEKMHKTFRLAAESDDIKYFKELREGIWEFRVQHLGDHFRLFAFWDQAVSPPLVVVTHGWRKDVKRTPAEEIDRAVRLRDRYIQQNQ